MSYCQHLSSYGLIVQLSRVSVLKHVQKNCPNLYLSLVCVWGCVSPFWVHLHSKFVCFVRVSCVTIIELYVPYVMHANIVFQTRRFLRRILALPLRPRYIRCSTMITLDIVEFDWFKTTCLSPKSAVVIEVISVDWAGVILVWLFLVKFPIFSTSYCTSHIKNSTNPWILLLNEFMYNWKSPISLSAKSCSVLVALRHLAHLVSFLSVHISSTHIYVCSMYQARKMAWRLVWFEFFYAKILVWCEMHCVELPLWHLL